MMLVECLEQKKMSMYRLAQSSGIPYATVHDICSGKTKLEKCSAETVYRLARALGTTMEELLSPCFMTRNSFELFKSSICHRVKEMGDIDFLIDTLKKDEIRTYFERKWYAESFYLLAMLDYISRVNKIPLCNRYDDLRRCHLQQPVYPASILAQCVASKSDEAKKQAEKQAIPEFMRFNIVEREVRDVV